jgi:hypothetical protein
MAQDKVAEILARFPGPVTLAPSRLKWVLILLGCAGFVAIGILLMPKSEAMTWFAIVFFGVGTAVALVMLMPGAGGMKLDGAAFEFTSLFRSHSVPWRDATGFMAGTIPRAGKMMVFFDDARARGKALGQLNVSMTGRNAAVPDTYGLSADDLASLMAQWRERALR